MLVMGPEPFQNLSFLIPLEDIFYLQLAKWLLRCCLKLSTLETSVNNNDLDLLYPQIYLRVLINMTAYTNL